MNPRYIREESLFKFEGTTIHPRGQPRPLVDLSIRQHLAVVVVVEQDVSKVTCR